MIELALFTILLVSVMLQFWSVRREDAFAEKSSDFTKSWIPVVTLILLTIHIIKEIVQLFAEGWSYFLGLANIAELIAYGFLTVCQWYYLRFGRNEFGNFIPDPDTYFQWYLLPMILSLHLILILEHLIAINFLQLYVTMIG